MASFQSKEKNKKHVIKMPWFIFVTKKGMVNPYLYLRHVVFVTIFLVEKKNTITNDSNNSANDNNPTVQLSRKKVTIS